MSTLQDRLEEIPGDHHVYFEAYKEVIASIKKDIEALQPKSLVDTTKLDPLEATDNVAKLNYSAGYNDGAKDFMERLERYIGNE